MRYLNSGLKNYRVSAWQVSMAKLTYFWSYLYSLSPTRGNVCQQIIVSGWLITTGEEKAREENSLSWGILF